MEYSDENLMKLVEELFQSVRRQTAGGSDDQRGPYMQREGMRGRRMGGPGERRPFPDRRMEGRGGYSGHMGETDGRTGYFGYRDAAEERAGEPPFMERRAPMARERILRLIGMEVEISQNKLAEYLGIRPQSVSELLVKLERDGYIVRTKNEQDKREILVSLSEKGKDRAREVEAMRTERISGFFQPLTAEEKEQLFHLLEKLADKETF